jgi:nucleotide-binding universal stress UspA family protein
MTKEATRRILVPIDFSSASHLAVEHARAIAREGADLVLMNVIPAPEFDSSIVPPPSDRWETQRLAFQAAEGSLQDLKSRIDWPAGGEILTHVSQGEAAEEIGLQAIALDASIIVMATHGRGAAGRLAFGSVADSVARHAPVPVLLVRPPATDAPTEVTAPARILVPIDGSDVSMEAVPAAVSLAKQCAAPVNLVTVRELNRAALMPSPMNPSLVFDDDGSAERLAEMLEAVATVIREEGLTTSSQVLTGPIAPAISDQVQPGDIVVMTSHGRSGVRRWLLGSVAEYLVRHADAPVLLVPPKERVLSATAGGTNEEQT